MTRLVGSDVALPSGHKWSRKIQAKQQVAACVNDRNGRALSDTLKRWELGSATYLLKPGHSKAIPLLADNPGLAGRLIDMTMEQAAWSNDSGVGARVTYLLENIADAMARIEAAERSQDRRRNDAIARARKVASCLAQHDGIDAGGLDADRFETLVRRGLERLDEPPDVVRILLRDDTVRRRILCDELLREELDQKVRAISKAEFDSLRERLFQEHAGLRRLYSDGRSESTGLRLKLIEFLRQEIIQDRRIRR